MHHNEFLASLLHKLSDSAPCSLGILERNGFFLDSYLIIFAFDWLLSAQHLLHNVLQCERSFRLNALIRFKKVTQLDIFVLVYLFLGRKSFPDLQQFSIIWLKLILLFAKLSLCEAVSNRRLADLLSSTPNNVWSVEQCELELLFQVHGLEPTTQKNLLVVTLEVFYDSLFHWLRIGCRVGLEEEQLDVVQLELRRMAREVIKTEQHSASLLAESCVPLTQYAFEKLCVHPRFPVCFVLDGNLVVLKSTGSIGFTDCQKRKLFGATHIGPCQKSNPMLALLSSSAPFSLKLMVLFGSNCQKSPVSSRLKTLSVENCLSKGWRTCCCYSKRGCKSTAPASP